MTQQALVLAAIKTGSARTVREVSEYTEIRVASVSSLVTHLHRSGCIRAVGEQHSHHGGRANITYEYVREPVVEDLPPDSVPYYDGAIVARGLQVKAWGAGLTLSVRDLYRNPRRGPI